MEINRQDQEDSLFIERAKRGDRDAFAFLVRRYEKKIFGLSMKMLGNYDDASDVTQDVFLQAYKNIKGFKGGSTFYTWLYRVAVNRCYRFYKKRKHTPLLDRLQHNLEGEGSDLYERTPSPLKSPAEALQVEEERRLVRLAIERLPEKLYQVTVLREIEEMPYEDIAGILHLSKGTVMSRLHRAKIALVSNMKKLGLDKY